MACCAQCKSWRAASRNWYRLSRTLSRKDWYCRWFGVFFYFPPTDTVCRSQFFWKFPCQEVLGSCVGVQRWSRLAVSKHAARPPAPAAPSPYTPSGAMGERFDRRWQRGLEFCKNVLFRVLLEVPKRTEGEAAQKKAQLFLWRKWGHWS